MSWQNYHMLQKTEWRKSMRNTYLYMQTKKSNKCFSLMDAEQLKNTVFMLSTLFIITSHYAKKGSLMYGSHFSLLNYEVHYVLEHVSTTADYSHMVWNEG